MPEKNERVLPSAEPLILASQSPRRRELLTEAGYRFTVVEPHPHAESGIVAEETPAAMVQRLAYQKAEEVAQRTERGIVIGCDTVAECGGEILGKPADRADAERMLRHLRGEEHHVYSGLCLWRRPDNVVLRGVALTRLVMEPITDQVLREYLDSGEWQGKAGAFGLQDRLGWIRVIEGSESNVVGLPLELLATLLKKLA